MKRDISGLKKQKFDILIIGSGIQGAAIAQELTKTGSHIALIDKNDFGSVTSANSLKIIHGGLRYLQHLNIKRMRESIKSRRKITQLAPANVKPMPCIMPTYGHGMKGKELLYTALFINDLISFDKNKNVDKKNYIKNGKILTKNELLKIIPTINPNKFNGAALWYDAIADDTERLTFKFIEEAENQGAHVANYTLVEKLLISDQKVYGVVASDLITGNKFEIYSKLVIEVTGPWLNSLIPVESNSLKNIQAWALALNIIVKKNFFGKYAVGLEGVHTYIDQDAIIAKGKRLYFFVPWHGHTMIGTYYKPYLGNPDTFQISRNDFTKFVDEINEIYPDAGIEIGDVSFYHAGIVPRIGSENDKEGDVQLEKHSKIIDHRKLNGIEGLISVRTVKYTTSPMVARKLKKYLKKILKFPTKSKEPFKFNKIQSSTKNINQYLIDKLDPKVKLHLQNKYNNKYIMISNLISENSELTDIICRNPLLVKLEIIYGIREEMALTLSDIVFRRTNLGTAACPPLSTLKEIALIMAEELRWDKERVETEIEAVQKKYFPIINISESSINVVKK